ncbi:MAG: DUF2283 domain-containing protein [Aquificota bacterium]|nr:MAG: DUF2283 domain-containing protein [Aquificota bacterium]
MAKDKVKVWHDEEADILYISLKEGPAVDSEEAEEGIRVEYGLQGEVVGVEIEGISRLLASSIIKIIEKAGISEKATTA